MVRRLWTFAIDEDLRRALKKLKARDGISESEATRRALRAFLRSKGVLKRATRK